MASRLPVDGSTGKYPEFKGNVATVYTHDMAVAVAGTVITAAMPRSTWTSEKPWARQWSAC